MQKTEGYEELLWLKNGAVDTRKRSYRRQARPMLRQEYIGWNACLTALQCNVSTKRQNWSTHRR